MGLCERCKKAQATFHITNIDRNSEKVERHLCERCSLEEGLVPQKAAPTSEILESFITHMKLGKLSVENLICDECSLSYVEFRNQGPLGCPHDYDAFREALHPLIQRAHDGATHHVGKTPRSMAKPRVPEQEIQKLRRQMDDAVTAEDYERAAQLRDRIRKLETR
jgi:protein arginine kinase activator